MLNPITEQWQWLLTSDVYSFRSCGNSTAQPTPPPGGAGPGKVGEAPSLSPQKKVAEDTSTDQARQRERQRERQQLQAVASSAAGLPVGKEQLLDAVHDILAKVHWQHYPGPFSYSCLKMLSAICGFSGQPISGPPSADADQPPTSWGYGCRSAAA